MTNTQLAMSIVGAVALVALLMGGFLSYHLVVKGKYDYMAGVMAGVLFLTILLGITVGAIAEGQVIK